MTIFAQIRSAAVIVYVSSRGFHAYRQRFTKLPIIKMASPHSTISSLNLNKLERKADSGNEKEKKSIFNLIFHHHSQLAHYTVSIIFQKVYRPFSHTHTHFPSVHLTRIGVFVISTVLCPDVSEQQQQHSVSLKHRRFRVAALVCIN